MPTILRVRGFEIAVRTHDHGPPHVHVRHGRDEVVINLGIGDESPYVREIRGMSRQDIRRAMDIVTQNSDKLVLEWSRIHG